MNVEDRMAALEAMVETLKPKRGRKTLAAREDEREKVKAAQDYALAWHKEQGKLPTIGEMAEATGCGLTTAKKAFYGAEVILEDREERGMIIDPTILPKTRQADFDRIIRGHKRALEDQFEEKVKAEVDKRLNDLVLPHYNSKMAQYNAVVKARNGVFTRAEFRKLVAALHPDAHPVDRKDKYSELFNMVMQHELVLCPEKELPTTTTPLPKSSAEMLKRRAEMMRKKK